MIKEIAQLGSTGHILHKATLPRQGDIYLILKNKHKEAVKIGRQTNMSQIKEYEKSPEKDLNEIEASNLLHIELRKVVIKMLNELS